MNKNKIKLMHPNVGKEELELVKQVFESGWLVEGPMVKKFENTVKDYLNVEYAIACTSATTGLELALRVIGIKKGDEVIIPDFTHPATSLVIQTLGAKPVLVDVDIFSYNNTAQLIEEAITSKTKAIMPVSIFGNPLDLEPIMELGEKHEIPVIEDAACSLGAEHKGQKVGSIADISVFSFHPRKVFTTGDGGLIVTNDQKYAELMVSMKKFGSGFAPDGKPGFIRWGTNYRMSDILGAVALGQVRKIDKIVNDRIEKAMIYNELLKDVEEIRIPTITEDSKSNYQTYAVYIKKGDRNSILEEMRKRNIEVQIGTYALHTQPFFNNLKKVGTLENSFKLYKNLLTLPLHSELSKDDQILVVDTLKELL